MRSRVLAPCSILRVQTWDVQAPAPSAVTHELGAAWPTTPGAVVIGRAHIICVGPADWLAIAADPSAAQFLQRLSRLFEAGAYRATDVSQALARIEVDGPEARELLAKGCSLDLHPSQFAPGRAARTRFAGMAVIVRCTAASTFECIVTLSQADYLLSWLEDSAMEFEATPT